MLHLFADKWLRTAVQSLLYVHQTILAIVAPPVCARCKTVLLQDTVLCTLCAPRIQKVTSHALVITKKYTVTVFAASLYQDIVQELIRAKQQRKMYAARLLGALIWEYTDLANQSFDYIVPVPLHWRRYARRGYNQAYEMAIALSKKSGKPVLNCLQRVRSTKIQAGLSGEERIENVKEAFAVVERYALLVSGARILLVDDVLTTGSTMRACVRALRMKRPSLIIGAVAARVN